MRSSAVCGRAATAMSCPLEKPDDIPNLIAANAKDGDYVVFLSRRQHHAMGLCIAETAGGSLRDQPS